MVGLRYAATLMAVVALLFNAHTGGWAQGSNKKRTDTFEQRYPPDQVPRQAPVPQAPTQPPADQFRARPKPRETEQNSSAGREQSKKLAMATRAPGVPSAKRSRSRVVVLPRSFLDAGTEVLPGERKFLDYALPPLHTPTDVVTNTGGRVGWHRSPLPGPFFPGSAPW
jgi:hypothetical protein